VPATREQLDKYVTYKFDGPRLNMDVPANQIDIKEQSRLSGIDGRFRGCLHKYYGNTRLVDLADITGLTTIADHDGCSFIQEVVFQKRGTSTVYRGFVVRWDAQDDTDNLEVGLAYTADGGTTWTYLGIWTGASTGITLTTEIEAATHRGYCLVAVEAKAVKTVYWSGSAVVVVDAGPGSFGVPLGALTESSQAASDSHYLSGNGVFQVCYRFYSSTRGIYSDMSSPLTVLMDLPKLAKAHGAVYLSSYGGDSGLLISGDIITVNGRTFKYIAAGGNVTIPAASAATVAAHAQALADAINKDTANCGCAARAESAAVYIEASAEGATGNTYTLSVTETGANTDDLSVTGANLTGGGETTSEYKTQCKAVLDFPANTAVVSTKVFADFAAMFDTVDIFRTVDLGQNAAAQQGAIFYLEQSLGKTASWSTSGVWDAMQVSIGTVPDTALPLLDQYDPETDSIVAPPQSGAIARYQGVTLMGQAASDDDPYDILTGSFTHDSAEYFSTYNQVSGTSDRGRPLRFLKAGDSAFAAFPGGFVHIYKSSGERPLQFVDTHDGPGLDGKFVAHTYGNSVLMISAGLLRIMGGNDANIADIAGAGRLIQSWVDDVSDYVSSGYDAALNASFFLNPVTAEALIVWHGTSGLSMLEGAHFRWLTCGPAISNGKKRRIYMVTTRGVIVSPETAKGLGSGSGTMFGLDASYTLSGQATGGSETTLVCSGATFHADMVGCYVYMINGDNAGSRALVESVNVGTDTLTFSAATAFTNPVANNDRFAISPVPLHIGLAPLRIMDAAGPLVAFDRVKMEGLKAKFTNILGTIATITDTARIGACRTNATTIEATTAELSVTEESADAGCSLQPAIDGIDVKPYIEYIGVGSSFEITDVEVTFQPTESKEVSD
jgi:hypothetical protein